MITLWLLAAAMACIETYAQYLEHGFSNWKLYLFAALAIGCIVMYFIKRKERLKGS